MSNACFPNQRGSWRWTVCFISPKIVQFLHLVQIVHNGIVDNYIVIVILKEDVIMILKE